MTSQVKSNQYHPWTTFAAAQQEALRLGERRVGSDLLLLALLRDHDIEELLHVTLASARTQLVALDNAALVAVGLPAIVEVATYVDEPIVGRPPFRTLIQQPRIRLSPAAKATLEEAYKPARRGKKFTPQRVLLALLDAKEPDPAAALLTALNVDRVRVRAELRSQLDAEDASLE